jgi:hypothetical protein
MSQTGPPEKGPEIGGTGHGDSGSRPRYWVEPPPQPREDQSLEPEAKIAPPHSVETAGEGVPYLPSMPTPALRRNRAAASPAWHLLLVLGGAGMIAGSCNSWLTSGSVFSSQGVSGIFGDELGEVSLIAGIVLALAALLMLHSGSPHLLVQIATAAAGAGLAAAGYFWYSIFRLDLIPVLRPSGVYPGWGMLLVILSSFVAFVASCVISVSGGR